jgi:hypothetical protein
VAEQISVLPVIDIRDEMNDFTHTFISQNAGMTVYNQAAAIRAHFEAKYNG